ncbi:MAG: TetR/AcrR family transcriptional regulator [Lachnospiraceae bacterium]|nr:TetR/AcrR family transcriptional regulator [Lachnospiraceae bacterium]
MTQPMNKSQSKYFHTAQLMDEALIYLLEVKAYEYITVKEICEKAGVNRSTFYLHYEGMTDLLTETMAAVNKKLFTYYQMEAAEFINQIQTSKANDLIIINEEFLTPYLRYVKDNQKIFYASVKNPSAMQTDLHFRNIKKYIMEPIMDKFQIPKDEQHYWIAFYMHGVNAIINEWISNECDDEPKQVINAIIHCVRPHAA